MSIKVAALALVVLSLFLVISPWLAGIGAIFIVWITYLIKRQNTQLDQLAAHRGLGGFEDFERRLADPSLDPRIAHLVYDEIRDLIGLHRGAPFPVSPDDHFFDDLLMDPDDIHMDAYVNISKKLTHLLQTEPQNEPQDLEVVNARSMILFFQQSFRHAL